MVIAVGLGRLRMSPKAFWATTPREIAAILGAGATSSVPLDRDGLSRLAELFPDD
jgi:uncharacterized phage protein (TIGR02216 family)